MKEAQCGGEWGVRRRVSVRLGLWGKRGWGLVGGMDKGGREGGREGVGDKGGRDEKGEGDSYRKICFWP